MILSMATPPVSRKAAKLIEAAEFSSQKADENDIINLTAGIHAYLKTRRELSWVEHDTQHNIGYAAIVVHFKGDAFIEAYERNGFEVEGQNGFYKATYCHQ